jgi:hypothetical protein
MPSREEYLAIALEAIPREQCVNIQEVLLYMPIGSSRFYALELEKEESIKAAIENEKSKVKQKLRKNWRGSDNPTLQIAEFKLCAMDQELEVLSTNRVKAEISMNRPAIEIVMNIAGELDSAQEDQG